MILGSRNVYNEEIMKVPLRDLKAWDDKDLVALFEKQVDLAMIDIDNDFAWFDVAFGYFFAITNSKSRSRYLAQSVYCRMTI